MSKKARFWVSYLTAFISRFKLVFFAGIVIGVFSFVLLQIFTPHLSGKIQTIGVVGEFTPDTLPTSITNLISVGLPSLSSSYEASDSGKTWTFHLAKDKFWQDGTPVTSKDIKYNFTDAFLSKPDNYTLVFNLKTPFAPFPSSLSKPLFKQGLLGTGIWKVTNLSLAGTFVESIALVNKNFNQMIYKFYPTEERAKLAYELGNVEKLVDIEDPKPLNEWKVTDIKGIVDKNKYVAVFFNTSDDILTDKDMRQALSYGIDKNNLSKDRALGPISPNSWAFNPQVKPYDYNVDRAKQLIEDSKISPDSKKNLKIKLTTTPDLLSSAEKIAKDWKTIGVNTTIQVTSFLPDTFQAFLAVYNMPTDPDQYGTWHSTQVETNITRYKSPRIDKLLEDGRLETDLNKRKGIYLDFQRFLLEDAPAAFLYYPTYYTITKK